MKKVPFSKIKPGGFFRMKGRTLYQRSRKIPHFAQVVSGPKTGSVKTFSGFKPGSSAGTPVTPVNARIVIDG